MIERWEESGRNEADGRDNSQQDFIVEKWHLQIVLLVGQGIVTAICNLATFN
jgi:hypothetical protein